MSHLTVTPSTKPTGLMRRHPSLRAPDRSPYSIPLPEGVQVEVRYLQPTAFIVNHNSPRHHPHQHQLQHHQHAQDVPDRSSGARISPLPEEDIQRVRSQLHDMDHAHERESQQDQDEEEAYRAYQEEEKVLARMDPFGRNGERTPVVGNDTRGQAQRVMDGVQSPIPVRALGGFASLVGGGVGRPQAFHPRGGQEVLRAQGQEEADGDDGKGTGRFQFQRANRTGLKEGAVGRRDSMEEMPPPSGAPVRKDSMENTQDFRQAHAQPLFRPRSGMGRASAPAAQQVQPQQSRADSIKSTNAQAQPTAADQSPRQYQSQAPQQSREQPRDIQGVDRTPPNMNNPQIPQRPARPTAGPQRTPDSVPAPEYTPRENDRPFVEAPTNNKWVRGNLQALVFDNDDGADFDGTVVGTPRKRGAEDERDRESVFNFTPNAKIGDAQNKIKTVPRFVIPKAFEDHVSLLKGINPHEIWRERIKAAKELTHEGQWSDPEQMIDNQRKRFDETKHQFDSFFDRLETLSDSMNEVLQRKTALTERYGEAGEHLSEQCVELQLATRSTVVKRRRVEE
ncbi:hypothetical protein IAT38_005351 [Cryptococcus sp. DSM 104549]